ncbi:MAG: hypothetical protein WDO71_19375 [Bacteroidota bacterium]
MTIIQNKCNYPLTFIGIQQLYDEQNGYSLTEVTKTMEVGFSYSSDQGMMSSIFTSLIGAGSEFNFAFRISMLSTMLTWVLFSGLKL